MNISDKIYMLRTENDMTQLQFGKIAGVSDKAVSTWEKGLKEPRVKSLQKICVHFGIDINKFVDTSTDVYKKESSPIVFDEGAHEITAIFKELTPDNRAKLLELSRLYIDAQRKNAKNG